MNKLLSFILPVLILTSCYNKTNSPETPINKEINMTLSIDNQELDVYWEDNDSVKALTKILPLTINMHEYGGFEQTGSIGASIIRNDKQIDVITSIQQIYPFMENLEEKENLNSIRFITSSNDSTLEIVQADI